MNKDLLSKVLSNLDRNAFQKYIFELWKLEDVNEPNNYKKVESVPDFDLGTLEQYFRTGREDEIDDFAGYHLILPFQLPLELLHNPQDIDLMNSRLLSSLIQYKKRMKRRMADWFFPSDGNYTIPYVKFVTNISGFEREFYFDILIPKFSELLQKLKIEAMTAIGSCDSFADLNPISAETALERFWNNHHKQISISIQDGKFRIENFISEKILSCGVSISSNTPCESLLVTQNENHIIREFESLLNEKTPERVLQGFMKENFQSIFGHHYDRVETEVWLKFPELDIRNSDRRLDIFLRNSVERDWEIFELKRCKRKITRSVRGVPDFVGEVYTAIRQLKNYQSILSQNHVKERLRNEGIDYSFPEMRLVIGKKPNISSREWRWLKSSSENGVKILTYDSLLDEMKSRFQVHQSFLFS